MLVPKGRGNVGRVGVRKEPHGLGHHGIRPSEASMPQTLCRDQPGVLPIRDEPRRMGPGNHGVFLIVEDEQGRHRSRRPMIDPELVTGGRRRIAKTAH